MHFLDAWTHLSFLGQIRLAAPAALMLAAILLPGRRLTLALTVSLALAVPLSGALPGGLARAAAWGALWLGIAAVLQRSGRAGARRPVERAGGFESSFIGLMLGAPLFGLLVLAIARQDLPEPATRAATVGALYASLGLVHLMVRRHVLRAAPGWAFTGFGLQVLEGAARTTVPAAFAPPASAVLIATAVTVALAIRLGLARARTVGSAYLSDAHDLHD